MRWLYEHDLVQSDPDRLRDRQEEGLDAESRGFARMIMDGVLEHATDLDRRLQDLARRWRVERMGVVDRAILRVGLYEILYEPETPTGVILSEAVDLAGTYSTPEAKRFVNGVLAEAGRRYRSGG